MRSWAQAESTCWTRP